MILLRTATGLVFSIDVVIFGMRYMWKIGVDKTIQLELRFKRGHFPHAKVAE